MRGGAIGLVGGLVAMATTACQWFLPDATGPAPAGATSEAGADAAVTVEAGMSPDAADVAPGPPCGLTGQVLRFDVQGTPSELVSDDRGAYFAEAMDAGPRITQLTSEVDGGVSVRSYDFLPDDITNLAVIWPDKSATNVLRLAGSNAGGLFNWTLDRNFTTRVAIGKATPDPLVRLGPSPERLILAVRDPDPDAGGSALICDANPALAYGCTPIHALDGTKPELVLGLGSDSTAAYATTANAVLKVQTGGVTHLTDVTAGGATPSGPIAARGGVAYWLADGNVLSIGAAGAAPTPITDHANVQAFAVDDTCVFYSDGRNLVTVALSGSDRTQRIAAVDVKPDAVTASARGVFWTTTFPPRVYAMLRPL